MNRYDRKNLARHTQPSQTISLSANIYAYIIITSKKPNTYLRSYYISFFFICQVDKRFNMFHMQKMEVSHGELRIL